MDPPETWKRSESYEDRSHWEKYYEGQGGKGTVGYDNLLALFQKLLSCEAEPGAAGATATVAAVP